MTFAVEVITLAPQLWPTLLGAEAGLVGKAFAPREEGREPEALLRVRHLRDYGKGAHRAVDDTPFGGGAGMVLQVEPLHRAITDARAQTPGPVILLGPRGARFNQATAAELAAGPGMILVCGRYVDREISLGDFVLSAGEPAAWAIIDAVIRLRPGVLGNPESLQEESFRQGQLEYPQYTRPVEYDGASVPEVLRSGNHAKIAAWRRRMARAITEERRPDLLEPPGDRDA